MKERSYAAWSAGLHGQVRQRRIPLSGLAHHDFLGIKPEVTHGRELAAPTDDGKA
jgi:hypothetical protein